MKRTAAPFLGSDIGDGFGEVPPVPVEVLGIVLALAIRMISGFAQDGGAVPACALAVAFGIFDANLDRLRVVGHHIAFGYGEATIAGLHLDAVVGDAKADREAESL